MSQDSPPRIKSSAYAVPESRDDKRVSLEFLRNRTALVQRFLLAELLAPPMALRQHPRDLKGKPGRAPERESRDPRRGDK